MLGCANFMPNWSIDCSEGMIGLVAEKMLEHGVQFIKPDITEEEFYSVLKWNGEDFLQFYYASSMVFPRNNGRSHVLRKNGTMERFQEYRNCNLYMVVKH